MASIYYENIVDSLPIDDSGGTRDISLIAMYYVNDELSDIYDSGQSIYGRIDSPISTSTEVFMSLVDSINQILKDDTFWMLMPILQPNEFLEKSEKFPNTKSFIDFAFPIQAGNNKEIGFDTYNPRNNRKLYNIKCENGDIVQGSFSGNASDNTLRNHNYQIFGLNAFEDQGNGTSFIIRFPLFRSTDFVDGKLVLDRFETDRYGIKIGPVIGITVYLSGKENYNYVSAGVSERGFWEFDMDDSLFTDHFKNAILKQYTDEPEDPFGPGGNTDVGGGGGSFDNTSTPIDIPNLPSISASSTGFISLFNPTLSQLNELSSYLWSDLFEIDGWKKLFADPMDAILGLSILPVAIPSGGTKEVKVGNIGTGISLTVASSQFVELDCGSIDVNEYWGAYLDYEPYTQAQIFLPYIGTRPISVDEIMGKTVRVVYHVDILTGACCCFVKCGDSVLYTYNGQCSIPIPITGANYASVVNGVISIAASVGSLVATGGASAPTAIPSIASSAVNQMKPQIEKSGSISGSAGVLNMQTPYLILIRPRQALPSKQNEFIGYPSLITVQLTELTGYTEVQSIHLENIPATQEELAEIQSLLEGGVIF